MNMSAILKSKCVLAQVTNSKKSEQCWVARFHVLIDFCNLFCWAIWRRVAGLAHAVLCRTGTELVGECKCFK